MLTPAAQAPVFGSLTCASISFTASAPFCPMSDGDLLEHHPADRVLAEHEPAMEMMRNSSGAIENIE
jgi:hypothetical protein